MSIEPDRPGGGVAAFMLSLSTLLALQKNGRLAEDELADIVEKWQRVCEARLHGDPLAIEAVASSIT